ncbi:inner membrane protein yieG [Bombardia bombarda]|uniref:Inner membrane protein yieG n=1 Tax=Bombardia bombarda TaxID=252184 RepID=A0AA40CEW0_9PEZI|nr:inner membrane protein yieG [Bombardia bombarda]
MQPVEIESSPPPPSLPPPPGGSVTLWKGHRERFINCVRSIDDTVNKSAFGRLFRLRGSGHPEEIPDANFSTEIRAGLTTFATMAYIIAVNSSVLADTGFDCKCDWSKELLDCVNLAEWTACHDEVNLDLITATAAISGLASILFGVLTNLPVALAPGMGLNAYFTYQVVGIKGQGTISYRIALMAIFIEGWIFMVLALTGLRHWLVKIIPGTIKTASGVGIGLFLTLIGMSYSSGIGIVTGAVSTPLAIGGCPVDALSADGECNYGVMTNPKTWVGIVGCGLFTAFLMAFRVKSAIIIGIAVVSILSWPRGTSLTYFPYTPEGQARWDFFKQIVAFHPIKHTLAQQQWDLSAVPAVQIASALFTFLYVDIIDCTATLYSMARFSNKMRKDDGSFPRSTVAYCTDAFCISMGSLLGCSPVTAFIESGAGIAEGGRSGLTAVATGLCFLVSLFFAPIFASIPPWATGSTLILVGCLMIRQVKNINWRYVGDAVPSFVTLTFIPFSYSVAYGLIAGLFTYAGLNLMIWFIIKISRGSLTPVDYEYKEYWTWKPAGETPWIVRFFSKGVSRIWRNKHREQNRDHHPGFPLSEGEGEGDDNNSGCCSPIDGHQNAFRMDPFTTPAATTAEEKFPIPRTASPQPFISTPSPVERHK